MTSGSDKDHDPSGPTTLYLARHGRTEFNAAGRLRGRLDPPLDAVGLMDVAALGVALAPFRPELVVSSPLRRATATAAAVAQACGLEVEVDGRFVDRDYGEFAGLTPEEVRAEWDNVDDAPGVEARAAVERRALEGLEAVAARASRAVVVAHDVVNRLLIARLALGRYTDIDEVPQRPGCFNVLDLKGGSWTVVKIDICPTNGASQLAASS